MHPTLRANLFPEVTDLFCRLPLSTLFYRLEAANLGDLLRLWVRPGVRIKGEKSPPSWAFPPTQPPPERGGERGEGDPGVEETGPQTAFPRIFKDRLRPHRTLQEAKCSSNLCTLSPVNPIPGCSLVGTQTESPPWRGPPARIWRGC